MPNDRRKTGIPVPKGLPGCRMRIAGSRNGTPKAAYAESPLAGVPGRGRQEREKDALDPTGSSRDAVQYRQQQRTKKHPGSGPGKEGEIIVKKRNTRILAYLAVVVILCIVIAVLVFLKKDKGMQPGGSAETAVTQEGGSENPGIGKKTLVMAVEVPLDAPYGKLATAYKENVETMSEGTLSIDIYENGLLGLSDEFLNSISEDTNAADIMLVPLQSLADTGCTETGKLLEPYSFDGHSGFLRWAVSKDAQAILTEPKNRGVGVTGLFFAENGFSHLFLKENGGSIKGKRIAGGADEENAAYVDGIGGEYDYIPSVDIKAALLDGSLDGAEQTLSFYKENELWEAAPCIVADSHLAYPCEAVIKLDTVEGLTEGELNVLKRAGEEAVKSFTQEMETEEKAMLEELEGYGASQVKLKK